SQCFQPASRTNLRTRASIRAGCRLEIGDTAGWKPALHALRFVSFLRRVRVSKGFRWSVSRVHNRPFTNLLYSFDHDALAGLETFLDDPHCAAPLARAHRLDMNFIVRVHDGDLIAAL